MHWVHVNLILPYVENKAQSCVSQKAKRPDLGICDDLSISCLGRICVQRSAWETGISTRSLGRAGKENTSSSLLNNYAIQPSGQGRKQTTENRVVCTQHWFSSGFFFWKVKTDKKNTRNKIKQRAISDGQKIPETIETTTASLPGRVWNSNQTCHETTGQKGKFAG